jgi:hypothetical protein
LRMRAILPGTAVVSDGLSCFAALASPRLLRRACFAALASPRLRRPVRSCICRSKRAAAGNRRAGRSSSGLIQCSQTSRTTCSACIARFVRNTCRAISPNSNGGSIGASTWRTSTGVLPTLPFVRRRCRIGCSSYRRADGPDCLYLDSAGRSNRFRSRSVFGHCPAEIGRLSLTLSRRRDAADLRHRSLPRDPVAKGNHLGVLPAPLGQQTN